jgi:hypothetical protein
MQKNELYDNEDLSNSGLEWRLIFVTYTRANKLFFVNIKTIIIPYYSCY